jgi:hypothetical protein
LPILGVMVVSFMLAQLEPHQVGWGMFLLGLGTLAWAGFDYLRGETSVGDSSGFIRHAIRRDEEPVRFQRTLMVVVFAGVVCLAASAFLLV